LKRYPALDVTGADEELLFAALDDLAPTALEERPGAIRVFFPSASARDEALLALAAAAFAASPIEVPDEDWARRSQENLRPVTVGRVTIVPDAESASPPVRVPPSPGRPDGITLVIQPSMGFGTGHHATTRLCLRAMQELGVDGRMVLDVGTGSGILAIAAGRLGADAATGIDVDEDAIQAARENLALNPGAQHVRLDVRDLSAGPLPSCDVVIANLTGAALVRAAPRLLDAAGPGSLLVLSGILRGERDEVVAAFAAAASIVWEQAEDEWVGVAMRKR
jgi:ribosomal protein L11 methyltransferase